MLYADVYFGYSIKKLRFFFLSEIHKEINGLVTSKYTRDYFSNEMLRYMKMQFTEEYKKGQSIPDI